MSTPYGGDRLPDPGWHDPDAPSLFYRRSSLGRSRTRTAGADPQAANRPLIHLLEAGAEPTRAGVTFDLNEPPDAQPAEVKHVALWHLALSFFHGHTDADHEEPCDSCEHGSWCGGRWLAQEGLKAACGLDAPMALFWRDAVEQLVNACQVNEAPRPRVLAKTARTLDGGLS